MEFERFINEVREKLQDMVDSGYRFEIQVINGLNGTVKNSILMRCEGMNVCPCINMDAYYRRYQSGEDMDALAECILESCSGDIPIRMEAVSDFTHWNFVKYRIFARLINTEKNAPLIKKCPHRQYLDLAFVYYVRVEGKEQEEYGTIQICNEHMLYWGVDEEILFQIAWKNILDTEDAVFERLEDILCSFFCIGENPSMNEGKGVELYVLGSRDRMNGAVQMCNPKALREAAETIGDDFWILPSSIHEVILVPLHQAENGAQGLAEIVKEVNDTQVEPNDILSYHVYMYNRVTGKIEIAA